VTAEAAAWPAPAVRTWRDGGGQHWRRFADGREEPYDPVTEADDQPGKADGRVPLFRRYSASELAEPVGPISWLVRGLLADPTYGMTAGDLKTLKTMFTTLVCLGLASGTPILGHFDVPEARSVVIYVGEGGRKPFQRRLQRLATAAGLRLADLPLHVSFDVAPIGGARFQDSLARDLVDLEPGLVVIDPYYAFHGGSVDAKNLHAEGELLSGLSARCVDADASLTVVNHFNQTGSGSNLKRITLAGGGEWVDSWQLLSHREDPDVEAGSFQLALDVGSRQWGGAVYDLDLNIGRFDVGLGAHDGDVTWDLRTASQGAAASEFDQQRRILDVLRDEPWTHTKSQLAKLAGGKAEATRAVIEVLQQNGQIRLQNVPAMEGGRQVSRPRYAIATEPRLDVGPSSPEVNT